MKKIKFQINRLVWQELLPPPRPHSDGKPSSGRENFESGGGESTWKPDERPPVPEKKEEKEKEEINPDDQEQMERLRTEMDKIKVAVFDKPGEGKPMTNEGPFLEKYIVPYIRDALLYKAVVENWDEDDLLDEYRSSMNSLCNDTFEGKWFTTLTVLKGFLWYDRFAVLKQDGVNRFISAREKAGTQKIKLGERYQLIGELRNKNEKIYGEIIKDVSFFDSLDKPKLKLVKEKILPFYTQYIVNEGIIKNKSKENVKKDFEDVMRKQYENCVEDDPKFMKSAWDAFWDKLNPFSDSNDD